MTKSIPKLKRAYNNRKWGVFVNRNYIQSVEHVLQTLGVGLGGLTSIEAKERLKKYGPNKLKEGEKPSLLQRFLADNN